MNTQTPEKEIVEKVEIEQERLDRLLVIELAYQKNLDNQRRIYKLNKEKKQKALNEVLNS